MPDDLNSQINQARQSGYSDDQIASYLGAQRPDLAPKIATARQQGHSTSDIVNYLGKSTAAPAPATPAPDLFERAVNYRSDDPRVDLPLGVIQGMAKGAASTGVGIGSLYRKLTGQTPLPEGTFASDVTPNAPGQGTGKFLEQAAEYAVPAGEVGKALEAAPLAARLAAQAGVGGAVSGLQSGGDPTAMALGAGLGAGGELAGAAVNRIRTAAQEITPKKFWNAFAATPAQKRVISDAFPTLSQDGLRPGASPAEMQSVAEDKLAELGQQYAAHEQAGVGAKTISADDVIADLRNQQAPLQHNGYTPSANQPQFDKIEDQIKDVQNLAQNGEISFAALRKLRDAANGRTNFASPQQEEDLYRNIGNVYRGGMDDIEPGTADLNRKYADYTALQKIAERNVKEGRMPPVGAIPQMIGSTFGGTALGTLGYHIAGPVGAELGGFVGATGGRKLAIQTVQALNDAAAAGRLGQLSGTQKAALTMRVQLGDNAGILRMLGVGGLQAAAQPGQ